MKKKETKKNTSNWMRRILLAVCILVFCYSGYQVITIVSEYRQGDKEYEDINQMFKQTVDDGQNQSEEVGAKNKKGEKQEKNKQEDWIWDFEKLKSINADAKGFIRQENTMISYPVLQGTDNEYYLHYTIQKTYNRNGSIFIDYRIQDGFDAKNCIIYGHNMWTNTMFGTLVKYNDLSYFKEHPSFDIYAGEKHYIYDVFASFEAQAEGDDVYQYLFTDQKEFLQWAEKQRSRSMIDTTSEVRKIEKDDHIITLSTCTTRDDESKRVVVLLVRRKDVSEK